MVTVEDVQRLMEEAGEAKAQQDEVAGLLGQSLTDVDTSEVRRGGCAWRTQPLRCRVCLGAWQPTCRVSDGPEQPVRCSCSHVPPPASDGPS